MVVIRLTVDRHPVVLAGLMDPFGHQVVPVVVEAVAVAGKAAAVVVAGKAVGAEAGKAAVAIAAGVVAVANHKSSKSLR